jgi:integrase/recombinase XerC
MSALSACQVYDKALKFGRDFRLPRDYPRPAATIEWPEENREMLERYYRYLSGGGTVERMITLYYLPMAGHVLGYFGRHYRELDLDADMEVAMDYITARGHRDAWKLNCRHALARFRTFLLHERGILERKSRPYDPYLHAEGLPGWIVEGLLRCQRVRMRNWREARLEENIRRFWSGHLRLWKFLCSKFEIRSLSDLKRVHFSDYVDWRLKSGASIRAINNDLRSFHGFMDYLSESGEAVPQVLLRIPCLKEPDPLPKFLTDAQVKALRDEFEERVKSALDPAHRRLALLDRAAFYLLWQGGLRRGEVEELRLEDLDLAGRRLSVRRGKGMKDRTIYLTESVTSALSDYLTVRGPGPTDHVFLFRNISLSKDLIPARLKTAGEAAGVKVYAHRLRHTCATQLLNAGCPVTSIQKFLGHKRLATTLTYARASDRTVSNDYFTAMESVERELELVETKERQLESIYFDERSELLAIVDCLANQELNIQNRLKLAEKLRALILEKPKTIGVNSIHNENRLVENNPYPLKNS